MTWETTRTPASALRRAAVRATFAPSVHNTQPWRFVLAGDRLEIHADWTRRLRALDPQGRQVLLGCGCALFNARVSLAEAGYGVAVERVADTSSSSLLARVHLPGRSAEQDEIAGLSTVLEACRINRQPFTEQTMPAGVVRELVEGAAAEGVEVFPIATEQHRFVVAQLSEHAVRVASADASYRAELRAWIGPDVGRSDPTPTTEAHIEAAIGPTLRDVDCDDPDRLPPPTGAGLNRCLLLLGTVCEDRVAQLRAGEALQRVLLELTRRGFSASLLMDVIEVAQANKLLRRELRLRMYPQVLLSVGRAAASPVTRRRRLVDVIREYS